MKPKYKSCLSNQEITYKDCVLASDDNIHRDRKWNPVGILIIILAWITLYFGVVQAHKLYDRVTFEPNNCSVKCHYVSPYAKKIKNLDSNFKRRYPNAHAKLTARTKQQVGQSDTNTRVAQIRRPENDNGKSQRSRLLDDLQRN
jgi:hypothetical protein